MSTGMIQYHRPQHSECGKLSLAAAWLFAALVGWIVAFAFPAGAIAQPAGNSAANGAPPVAETPKTFAVDPGRKSKKTVIITIQTEIDEWVVRSVQRRIKEAEALGADTIVFDIDSPGGELTAMLAISQAIKTTRIPTIAWIHPTAYSAAAVIAMACRDMVVTPAASFGDALPIEISLLEGYKPIPDAEREKFIGPILADLVESARRSGRDEILVQGLVRRGIELWLVEHKDTGERVFVSAEQYKLAVGSEPDRSIPSVPSVTGSVDGSSPGSAMPAGSPQSPGEVLKGLGRKWVKPPATSTTGRKGEKAQAAAGAETEAQYRFKPASPTMSPDLIREVNTQLELKRSTTTRPDMRGPDHAGKYKPVAYISTGAGVLTFKHDQLLAYGLASDTVADEGELSAYLGAPAITVLGESILERSARFLSWLPIKGLLVAVFLIAVFVEMMHPGVSLPGGIALLALVGLVVPQMLVSLSSWWMPAAIILGIVLIVTELFLFPGVIVVGLAGAVLLFGGLIGFIVTGSGGAIGTADGNYALATILLSFISAGGTMWFVGRNIQSIPGLQRLVLQNSSDDSEQNPDMALAAMASPSELMVGQVGMTITPLRPAGRVQFGEHIYDVVAGLGFIDAGTRVRVITTDAFRTSVELAQDDAGAAGAASAEQIKGA